ncbi:hypothetical protein [Metabacillus iocasae]|uniref:Lipoprotein n=1 Tax=Priestia iocasae TaxID=2291674 RepID=A0ABS2QTT7_9BACI|nr:hypothetical protein [Metabacillus iocasae]MBM7702842.1 hypothetical protein [Metabacillus iocasae]
MRRMGLLIAVGLLLTACSQKETTHYDYTFKGESEHWTGAYSAKGTEVWKEENERAGYEHKSEEALIITYKGAPEPIQLVNYTYETTAGSGSGTRDFTNAKQDDDVSIKTHSSSEGSAKVNENDLIHVTVKWNGQEETIELKNK